jgi:hypothetical protein
MVLLTRILFVISLIAFALFTFDINIGLTNLTMLYIFMIGFSLTFILAFVKRKQISKWILWVSAVVVLLFVGYSVLVNFLWGIS